MEILLSPVVAFLIYIPLVLLLVLVGRGLAGKTRTGAMKNSIYGSGEVAPTSAASPGYKPFFVIAFFFAFVHLGILVLGTGTLSLTMGIFLLFLILALVALLLG
jgi:NADH:ubiquinone oxidoreductase subunit 3 (subunit A)